MSGWESTQWVEKEAAGINTTIYTRSKSSFLLNEKMGQWPIFRGASLLLPQISASSPHPCIALPPPALLRSGLFQLISADRPRRLIGHDAVCKETRLVLSSRSVIQPGFIPVFPLSSPNPTHVIERFNPLPPARSRSLCFFLALPVL